MTHPKPVPRCRGCGVALVRVTGVACSQECADAAEVREALQPAANWRVRVLSPAGAYSLDVCAPSLSQARCDARFRTTLRFSCSFDDTTIEDWVHIDTQGRTPDEPGYDGP